MLLKILHVKPVEDFSWNLVAWWLYGPGGDKFPGTRICFANGKEASEAICAFVYNAHFVTWFERWAILGAIVGKLNRFFWGARKWLKFNFFDWKAQFIL